LVDLYGQCGAPDSCGAVIKRIGILDESMHHVESTQPAFVWSYHDFVSFPQDSFQLEVSTNSDWTTAEIWDPGPVASSDTFVTYAGAPLIDGSTYYLRLRVHNGVAWSNWYYATFRMNSVPAMQAQYSPIDSAVAATLKPTLKLGKAVDPEDSYILYDFEVIKRGGQIVSSEYDFHGTGDTIQWQIQEDLSENEIYWWRARAYDTYEYSNWSEYEAFWVNATEEAPLEFLLIGPPDTSGNKVFDMFPTFSWTESLDPDPRDSAYYTFYLSIDSNFQFVQTVDSLWSEISVRPDSLAFGTRYWWKVKATDNTGRYRNSSNVLNFRTWKLGDANGDWNVNAIDVTFLINYLYKHLSPPSPLKAGDINGSCVVNALDITYMINYLYKNGAAPKAGCEWGAGSVRKGFLTPRKNIKTAIRA
jgi:hypothetical protein